MVVACESNLEVMAGYIWWNENKLKKNWKKKIKKRVLFLMQVEFNHDP